MVKCCWRTVARLPCAVGVAAVPSWSVTYVAIPWPPAERPCMELAWTRTQRVGSAKSMHVHGARPSSRDRPRQTSRLSSLSGPITTPRARTAPSTLTNPSEALVNLPSKGIIHKSGIPGPHYIKSKQCVNADVFIEFSDNWSHSPDIPDRRSRPDRAMFVEKP
jgi:hypothetical protein